MKYCLSLDTLKHPASGSAEERTVHILLCDTEPQLLPQILRDQRQSGEGVSMPK